MCADSGEIFPRKIAGRTSVMTNSDNATNLIVEIVHSVAAEYGFPPE
jgi:hypothetical protein